jgi:hypothetical protein
MLGSAGRYMSMVSGPRAISEPSTRTSFSRLRGERSVRSGTASRDGRTGRAQQLQAQGTYDGPSGHAWVQGVPVGAHSPAAPAGRSAW